MRQVFFIMLFFSALNSWGQALSDTVKLKEVYVTSSRQITERAVYVQSLDSIILSSSRQSDLSELLQKHSSLYIKSYGAGGLSTASFRGTSASHTQVLWNGLSINSPLWGQTDLSMMPVFFTDDVSLYYGSSSLLKTSGGLGGCISLNNTPEWNAGIQIDAAQNFGSFGYMLSQLKFQQSGQRFITNTRVFYEKAKNNFRYYDNASGLFDYTRQKNADYDKKGFLQEFYYKPGARQFAGIKLMTVLGDRNLPPIMSFRGASRYENQQDQMLNLIGEWKYYGNKSSISVNSGLIRNQLEYLLTNSTPGGIFVNYDTESVSHVFSNKAEFRYNFSNNTVWKSSADLQLTRADYSDRKEAEGFEARQNDFTLQSSVHHAFSKAVSGYFLYQQKILDGEFMPVVAATGVEYHLTSGRELIMRANVGKNLHIPNLNDKYFRPGGNPDLLPESGYQADAGMQINGDVGGLRCQIEITAFAAWIDNWILWHPSEFRYWTADNVEKVFSRGSEVNASMKGDAGFFRYQLKGNYAFTRTTNEDTESPAKGMQLIYIPRHVSNFQVFLEKSSYSLVLSFHNTGSRYTSTLEDKTYRMPFYFLTDAGISKLFRYKQHSATLNFKINNILNKQYQIIEQRAMPGRNFSVGIAFSFSEMVTKF